MKLYAGWSLNPQKVLFALKELKLEAVTVDLDLFKGEQLTKAFTALNPMQKVPVMEDHGFILWESNAILVYLGERERTLWPNDALGRADALRWMFFEARHLSDSAGNLWFNESIAPQLDIPVDSEAVSRGNRELERPMATLEQHLARREWMLGSAFSLVDCSIGTVLAGLAASRYDWSAHGAVRTYVDRIRRRTGWQATAPRY